jgi:hypothetical protein
VPRIGEDLVGGALFHDPAQIHDRNAMSDLAHHREIMRDEQVRQTTLVLEIREQVQDLCLD